MGTASVLDPDGKKRFLGYISEGYGKTTACRMMGITLATLRRALSRDQDFADEFEMLQAEKVEKVEDGLYELATGNTELGRAPNIEAIKFWLKNQSDEWSDTTRVEHTGKGGGPMLMAHAASDALMGALRSAESRREALALIEGELLEDAIMDADIVGELAPAEPSDKQIPDDDAAPE